MTAIADRWGFTDGGSCLLPLVLLALEETRDSAKPVLVLGYRADEARLLRNWALDERRQVVVVEEDLLKAFEARSLACDGTFEGDCATYDDAVRRDALWSVAVVNHAPGERRKRDVVALAARCEVVVVNDTEPDADYGYRLSEVWPLFRSKVDVKTDGRWASAASKTLDLTRWRGAKLGEHVVSGRDDDLPRGSCVTERLAKAVEDDE